MNRRVFRYELNIDDEPHQIPDGKVVHLSEYRMKHFGGARRVEAWVEVAFAEPNEFGGAHGEYQLVQIIGTGQPVPDGATHLATCLDGSLVWHLYRLART